MKSCTSYKIREIVKTLTKSDKKAQKALNEIEDAINKDSEYNGYSNFETWLMSLNLDNNQSLNDMVMTIANAPHLETYDKADSLKSQVEDMFYVEEYGIYKICDTWTDRDFKEIDWCEIIESHIDEEYESDEDGAEES